MSSRKWFGLAVATALVAVLASTVGCSSSSSGGPGPSDGSADTGQVVRHPDGAIIGSSSGGLDAGTEDAGPGGNPDMTTGKKCTTNADCQTPGGGINVCSNDPRFMFQYSNVVFTNFPTPVCEVPPPNGGGNCDPCGGTMPCDRGIHFCDGPDQLSAPGLCVPNSSTNPLPGQGRCYPFCTFPSDGSPPMGCVGHDKCSYYSSVLLSAADGGPGNVLNLGICSGGCEQDSDCADLGAGWSCQSDLGQCTKSKATRTKTVGASCTGGSAASSDTSTGACYCLGNNTNMDGYCTSSCVIGGTPCPTGFTCDALEQAGPLQFGDPDAGGITEPAIAKQSPGLEGLCIATCSMPSDAGAVPGDAGVGGCPANSACQAITLAGPDCLP